MKPKSTLSRVTRPGQSQKGNFAWRNLAIALVFVSLIIGAAQTAPTAQAVSPRTVAVNLFEWKWTDIKQECTNFLGPKGFAAVQVSPPNEHAAITNYQFSDGSIVNRPWWERYQPVSYTIVSRSGSLAEFTDMVKACNDAGVDVYVDAVINHMTNRGATGATWGSVGSTAYTKYSYTGLYGALDFHNTFNGSDPTVPNTCINGSQTIQGGDYGSNPDNRVRMCELDGLADLRTGFSYVRGKIADYMISLVNLPNSNGGVKGFRIDAAKHMNPEDITDIIARVKTATGKNPYFYLEIIDKSGSEAIKASDYYGVDSGNADIHEFKYEIKLDQKFLNTGGQRISELISGPVKFGEGWGLMPNDKAVSFVTNHDEERTEPSSISYKNGIVHNLANIFMLAWPYGYPHLFSGYSFNTGNQADRAVGPPAATVYVGGSPTNCSSALTPPAGQWVCEHRRRAVANMVGFRNASSSMFSYAFLWNNGGNAIAFARGNGTAGQSKGFVVINGENFSLGSRSYNTGMPAGTYCDVIHGDFSGTTCSGPTIVVNASGWATFTVNATDAVAFHADAKLP